MMLEAILGSVDTETFWEFILNLNRLNRGSLSCKLIISFFHVQSILSGFTNVLFKHAFSQFVQFATGKRVNFADGKENMLLYCFIWLVVTIVKYYKSNYFHTFTLTLRFGLFFFQIVSMHFSTNQLFYSWLLNCKVNQFHSLLNCKQLINKIYIMVNKHWSNINKG